MGGTGKGGGKGSYHFCFCGMSGTIKNPQALPIIIIFFIIQAGGVMGESGDAFARSGSGPGPPQGSTTRKFRIFFRGLGGGEGEEGEQALSK